MYNFDNMYRELGKNYIEIESQSLFYVLSLEYWYQLCISFHGDKTGLYLTSFVISVASSSTLQELTG